MIKLILNRIEHIKKYCKDPVLLLRGTEIDTVKKALEKQIPKKVIKYNSCPEYITLCPTCGSSFVERHAVLMRYCNNCGQALKE